MSASGNHNRNCGTAVGHVCRCTGCFGSLHGWEGWTILAKAATSERERKRETLRLKWKKHYRPRGKRLNKNSKSASSDLARLDIADWLAEKGSGPAVPEPRRPLDGTIIGARAEGELNARRRKPSSTNVEPSESQLEYAEPADGRENGDLHELQTEGSGQGDLNDIPAMQSKVAQVKTPSNRDESRSGRYADENDDRHELQTKGSEQDDVPVAGSKAGHETTRSDPDEPLSGSVRSRSGRSERDEPDDGPFPSPSAVDQIIIFAEAMTTSVREEIGAELDDNKNAQEIKRQLADHFWCDLFIGLVKVVQEYQDCLNRIPEDAKKMVKEAICGSSMQVKRPAVTEKIVDIVVDRVWQAFKTAAFAGYPLLSILDSKDVLRSLRILAVFTCPAPENHREVYEYALKPLGNDARQILTERTKKWLANVFEEWATADEDPASADLNIVKPQQSANGKM